MGIYKMVDHVNSKLQSIKANTGKMISFSEVIALLKVQRK